MKQILSVSDIADNKGMTSLEIAEVTGKQHAHIMRDIRNILTQGVSESNFGLMFRISKLGNGAERKAPYYYLTPKGCLILASGYDALLREKIVNRLEYLEKDNKPQLPTTYLDALKALVKNEEQRQHLVLENKRQAEELQVKDSQITELNTAVSEMQPNHLTLHLLIDRQKYFSERLHRIELFRIFATFNNYLWRGWKLCHKTVGHFYARYFLTEIKIYPYQRYWVYRPLGAL